MIDVFQPLWLQSLYFNNKFKFKFAMPNGAIRIKIPPFDSALEIVLIMDVKCITKQQYSSDLWPLSLKANCIVDKSLKIIKLIINKCRTFDP